MSTIFSRTFSNISTHPLFLFPHCKFTEFVAFSQDQKGKEYVIRQIFSNPTNGNRKERQLTHMC